MDACLLDMLHDPSDVCIGTVGQAIHVDFDRIGEVAVDEQRPLLRDNKFGGPVER